MKLGRRITAAVLCAIMVLYTVSAAEFPQSENQQTDFNPIVQNPTEKITEDTPSAVNQYALDPDTDGNSGMMEGEELSPFETREARIPPMTVYDLLQCSGSVYNDKGNVVPVTEYLGTQGGAASASFTLKNKYARGYPLVFTFYKYGSGSVGFNPQNGIDCYVINGSLIPYDCVFNSYGDAVGYKIDNSITVQDTSLSQITLVSNGRSFVEPRNTFVRSVTVKFDDDRTEAPTTPKFIPDPANPSQYLYNGRGQLNGISAEYRCKLEYEVDSL